MKDPQKEAIDNLRNQELDNRALASHAPVMSPVRGADIDPAIAWIEELIAEHTPAWALLFAWLVTYKGFGWLRALMPYVRAFTDLEVKTETNIKGGKGFRPGSTMQKRTLRVFKRGVLLAEKEFDPVLIRNSPYKKLV